MHQEEVGETVQSTDCFSIIDRDRLLAEVAAGHHQSLKPSLGEQQIMQRRVGQKNSQVTIEGRNLVGKYARRFFREQDFGSRTMGRCIDCRTVRAASFNSQISAAACKSGTITAKGFSTRRFRCAQQSHGRRVRCIHSEMKSAQSLYRDNQSGL